MKLAGPRTLLRPITAWLGAALVAVLLLFGVGIATAQAGPPPDAGPAQISITDDDGDDDYVYSFGGTMRDEDREPLVGVEIIVSGNGFENSGETDDSGAWRVGVPDPGTYTVTINTDTLPDGVQLRDPAHESREFEISAGSQQQSVLFGFGDPGETQTTPTTEPSETDSESDAPADDEEIPVATEQQRGQGFMAGLTQRAINGAIFGLMLALAAIGITLIFGTTGVNNFAQGEMLTFGGVMFYFTTTIWGWPFVVAVAATLLACALFGWLNDAALFKPLRKRRVGLVQVLIVTIGLSILLRYLYQFIVGGGTNQISGVSRGAPITIGPAVVSTSVLISAGIAILVLIGVAFFLTQTRIGKATRAVSDNSSLAAASGINVNRVIRIVWTMAGLLTGLGGLLYTYFIGGAIRWDTGFQILLLLFAAVTLGGLGSAFGALIGALVIGIVTEVSTLWLPADVRYAVGLFILILVLLFRPQGILGRKERIG
ncbi:MAG TPA: branched-chain amino acid ABC transporter permease [Candidatus Agrococcus pullicola]|uniref:Branched-chain amino acid ABC transporter permease n=1 Tax=Candidatus Agrococcus pullicola TaxID=2838429 RepID=A0A9D2CAR4_9MICO|nr:branched-chain amino acid ABC transporter permease [Candidatus Agrococcus pullicola]